MQFTGILRAYLVDAILHCTRSLDAECDTAVTCLNAAHCGWVTVRAYDLEKAHWLLQKNPDVAGCQIWHVYVCRLVPQVLGRPHSNLNEPPLSTCGPELTKGSPLAVWMLCASPDEEAVFDYGNACLVLANPECLGQKAQNAK